MIEEAGQQSIGQQTESYEGEILEVKSPVSVNGVIRTKQSYSEIVAEVISLIGSKGVTVEMAIHIIDLSREAIMKCTLLQTEYTP